MNEINGVVLFFLSSAETLCCIVFISRLIDDSLLFFVGVLSSLIERREMLRESGSAFGMNLSISFDVKVVPVSKFFNMNSTSSSLCFDRSFWSSLGVDACRTLAPFEFTYKFLESSFLIQIKKIGARDSIHGLK